MHDNSFKKRVIAIVYDFDGTLAPNNMHDHGLLQALQEDPNDFWKKVVKYKTTMNSSMILSYMHLLMPLLQRNGIGKDSLREFGKTINTFRGVDTWFKNIDHFVRESTNDRIVVQHYILSSGLEELLQGHSIANHVHKIFASSYLWESDRPVGTARAITDASKPQYIFRIVKGKEDYAEDINQHVPESLRPIPFSHVIFIGDGETDIPSFTVTKNNGGHSIAVYNPSQPDHKRKCKGFYDDNRVNFFAEADFRQNKRLWILTTIILKKVIADIRLEWADHLFRTYEDRGER